MLSYQQRLEEKNPRSTRNLVVHTYWTHSTNSHIISDQIMKNMNLTFISVQTTRIRARIVSLKIQEKSAVVVKHLLTIGSICSHAFIKALVFAPLVTVATLIIN